MEVGVTVWVENTVAGTKRHVSSAFVTFVAIDRQGKPVRVPKLQPETDEEKRRYEDAGRRREHRGAERKQTGNRPE